MQNSSKEYDWFIKYDCKYWYNWSYAFSLCSANSVSMSNANRLPKLVNLNSYVETFPFRPVVFLEDTRFHEERSSKDV